MPAFPASPVPSWYASVTLPERNGIFYIGVASAPSDVFTQAVCEADPYNWTFYTNADGFGARRRQEGGMVDQFGESLLLLLTRITAYENYLAAKSVPVSHEWGELIGSVKTQRAYLVSPGNAVR